ncbi:MAG TPA: hypothetical protein VFD90_12035 [Gaiellales bacterium]|nr:hypothetical protein [Gaiellales bacterium]
MSAPRHPDLLALLEQASEGLGDVELTQAYGCDAVAAAGRAYALVADDGRIAVRLPDWDLFTAAFELPGSEPLYEKNERRVGHWVLLPGAVMHDVGALGEWVRRAHELTAVDV